MKIPFLIRGIIISGIGPADLIYTAILLLSFSLKYFFSDQNVPKGMMEEKSRMTVFSAFHLNLYAPIKTSTQKMINKIPWICPTTKLGHLICQTYFNGMVRAKARYEIPSAIAKYRNVFKNFI